MAGAEGRGCQLKEPRVSRRAGLARGSPGISAGDRGGALRARGERKEEGDGADRWAMLVSRRCERWQVGRGAVRGAGRGVQGDARSGPGRVRVRQAERARVEAGAGWAETEEGGEWAAARVGPTWAAEMGWWVWVLGSFPFLILFSLPSISNSNKV